MVDNPYWSLWAEFSSVNRKYVYIFFLFSCGGSVYTGGVFCPVSKHHIKYSYVSSNPLIYIYMFVNIICSQIFTNECIFSYDQAAPWMVQSVCLSVCPSVQPSARLSHLFHYVLNFWSSYTFQELLPMTEVMSMQRVEVRGQRSRSHRSNTNFAVPGAQRQFEFTYDDDMMHKAWFCLGEVPIVFHGHPSNVNVTRLENHWF